MQLVENRASRAEILDHLARCDARFVPPLSDRVDLRAYAQQLHERARRFEAWDNGGLIGLVAAYFNGEERAVFISNVSVDEGYLGQGIATALLTRTIASAGATGLTHVRLRVGSGNVGARQLYEKLGFRAGLAQEGQTPMQLDLPVPLR